MEQTKENKMGVMSVNKLLVSMSLPMIISMLVQALYNIVDSVYVSQISENALTTVSLTFPVQNLMIAVATGTGVGVNALVSKSLGEKNFENANRFATSGVFLAIVSALLFMLVGAFCSEWFFKTQTDILEIINDGKPYMMICCVFSFGVFGQIMFERLMQATGKTIYTMITQGVGAIINIVLDPIFIFGWFGIPAMGVTGAAVATVIGQVVACVLAYYLNRQKNKELHVNLFRYKPCMQYIRKIYSVGFPSIVNVSIGSVMNYVMNGILIAFTPTAIAVFGIIFKLQSFVFMPVFGLNNGLVPIFSYNFGAQKRDRMMKALRYTIIYSMAIMILGLFLMQIYPREMLRLFDASDNMLRIGVPALRIVSISFVFAGFCITVGSAFQAIGQGYMSTIVSVARQLLVLVPVAYALSLTGKLELVWWAFPIAEIASLTLTVIFLIYVYKKIISKIKINHENERKTME